MEKLSWWKRAIRWFRGWEIVDSILSLAGWFKAIAGLLVAVLGTAGSVVGAVLGSGVISAVVGLISGVGVAVVIGGIIASRLQALFPAGSGVFVKRANGFNVLQPIGSPPPTDKIAGAEAAKGEPAQTQDSPALSQEDRQAVRDMRDLWKDDASPASEKMRYMALTVLGTIEERVHWANRLFDPDIARLKDATDAMDEMFKHSHITLQEARQKFDAFFAAYATTAGDLYYINRDHLPFTESPGTEWYKRWEIANAAFMKGLKSLYNQPEYEHELKLIVSDSGARKFLDRRLFPSEVTLSVDEDGYLSSESPIPDSESQPEPKTEKERYQLIADTLAEKHGDGVVRILNDGYANAESLIDAPIHDDREWVADTLKAMDELGCTKAEIERVEILGMYEQMGEMEDAEIDRLRSIFNERLVRVRAIANSYQLMAHGITQ